MPNVIVLLSAPFAFSLPVTIDLAATALFILKAIITIVVAVASVGLGYWGFAVSAFSDGRPGQFLFGAAVVILTAVVSVLAVAVTWTFHF